MDITDGDILDQASHSGLGIERTPVIAFTRCGDLKTKLAAFERGVDDILVVPFSPEEFIARVLAVIQNLLYLLAANAGRLMTRDEILDYLWGVDFIAESNVVDRHVRNLRAKLQNDYRRPRFIATVPGQGYRFLLTSEDQPG